MSHVVGEEPESASASRLADKRLSRYLPTLDGWRAIAIVAVLISHATDQFFAPDGRYPNASLYGLTRNGEIGVDIFFGISGFLITMRLLAELDTGDRVHLAAFYTRRFFRIVPPYVVYLAIATLLAVRPGVGGWGREIASCLLFVRNYSTTGGWFTSHFWSLAIEEHFYLLWPACLALVARRNPALFAFAAASTVGAWRIVDQHAQILSPLLPGVAFYHRTDIRLDALLMGCAAAIVFARQRDWFARVMHPALWAALVVGLVFCVVRQPPLALTWMSMLVPLLLIGTVSRPTDRIGLVLEFPVVTWIGRMSYSLYLWQQLFLIPANEPQSAWLAPLQVFPLNIVAVFVCAAASYYSVERPLIKVGHRLAAAFAGGRQSAVGFSQ